MWCPLKKADFHPLEPNEKSHQKSNGLEDDAKKTAYWNNLNTSCAIQEKACHNCKNGIGGPFNIIVGQLGQGTHASLKSLDDWEAIEKTVRKLRK